MSISVAKKKQDGVVNDSQTSLNMKLHEVTLAGSEWFLRRDEGCDIFSACMGIP